MLAMRCAACQGFARQDTTICARAAAEDAPGNLGGYRRDYPAPLLGCMADIQRSEAEDVGGSEAGSRATGVGLRAALGRATPGIRVGGWGLDASWRGRTRPRRSDGSPSCRAGAERSGSSRGAERATVPPVMAILRTGESQETCARRRGVSCPSCPLVVLRRPSTRTGTASCSGWQIFRIRHSWTYRR
jgi:hypothetical protein